MSKYRDTAAQPGYFPIFIDMDQRPVTIYGGGSIARRRVETLLQFGAAVTVIAPRCEEAIARYGTEGRLCYQEDVYRPGTISEDACMVIAATDDSQVNHQIYLECRHKNITVNNASDKSQCDFYFPAIVREGPFVMGVTASGTDHGLVRRVSARLRSLIGELIEECKRQ